MPFSFSRTSAVAVGWEEIGQYRETPSLRNGHKVWAVMGNMGAVGKGDWVNSFAYRELDLLSRLGGEISTHRLASTLE